MIYELQLGLGGQRTQIHIPKQSSFKLKPATTSSRAQQQSSSQQRLYFSGRIRKISSNLDPQKHQIHSGEDPSDDEEDEDETNESEAHLYRDKVQEFSQMLENSHGKAMNSSSEKWPTRLISSPTALASKQRMKASPDQTSSKLKQKKAKRDVEVHGGRVVRSTVRKDRHSKVCTARGPRDRRVRLSPNTAIQFYDVQDRLGYDRPSKAIDWLMKEAKSAIDALDDSSNATTFNSTILMQPGDYLPENNFHHQQIHHNEVQQSQDYNGSSFFSMLDGEEFNNHSQGNRNQAQGLSLSFQDLSFLFGNGNQNLLPASAPLHAERDQRTLTWNANYKGGEGSFNSALPFHFPYHHHQQQQQFYQREPLQSSFSPSFQAVLNDQHPNLNYSCLKYANEGLLELSSGARIQGVEEQNHVSGKPSSVTSLLHFQN